MTRGVGHIFVFIVAIILIIPLMIPNSFAEGVSMDLTLNSYSVDCHGSLQGTATIYNYMTAPIYINSAILDLKDVTASRELNTNTFSYSALPVPVGGSVNLPFTITQTGGTTERDPEQALATMTVDYSTQTNESANHLEVSKPYLITGCPLHQYEASPSSDSQSGSSSLPIPSRCLIATAAFGSDLAPQVQFLRVFRDQNILSTASGSSFMNVFNTWYYSFSPSVANYERGQPWMQHMVRTSIYPLLGMLTLSQKAYSVLPGEYGAISAGLIASSLIGAVYFFPFALAIKQVRKQRLPPKIAISIIAASVAAVIISVIAANKIALMTSASLLVLTTLSISAIYSANAITRAVSKLRSRNSTMP